MSHLISAPDQDNFVLVGKVAKPHGIKGELKIFPYSGQPEDFTFFKEIFLFNRDKSEGKNFTVTRSRGQGKFAILKLDGIEGRDSSELLSGQEVWASKEMLPPLEDDEFYWHEMVGLQVVTDAGRHLGTVTSLFASGAQDILVITGTGQEYLIPAQNEFIVTVDNETNTLVVSPPAGLLEINT